MYYFKIPKNDHKNILMNYLSLVSNILKIKTSFLKIIKNLLLIDNI